MNILIAGATGKTGQRLTEQLRAAGHHPIAMVRESSDTGGLPEGTETRLADLTDLPQNVCEGADVVVFAAGSGGETSEDMTDKVDRDGAKALIDRARDQQVARFVMLSSIGAGDPDPDSDLAHYLEAKHAADEHLKASGLDYVIVRPVALTEDDGARNLRLGDGVDPKGQAHRGDVAAVLARAVDDDMLRNRVVELESC